MARLLFFGKLADAAGAREREAPLPKGAMTVGALIGAIAKTDTMLGAMLRENSVRYIVNEKFQTVDAPISDADEIAFLPPVSGG